MSRIRRPGTASLVIPMSGLESEIETAMRWSRGERSNHQQRFSILKRLLFVTQTEPAFDRAIDFIGKHERT